MCCGETTLKLIVLIELNLNAFQSTHDKCRGKVRQNFYFKTNFKN